jgi:BTB/POZ domain
METEYWTANFQEISQRTEKFLYDIGIPARHKHFPARNYAVSLQQRMIKLLDSAKETGDVTFILGESQVEFKAHKLIVEQGIAIPLLHPCMGEGNTGVVPLPQFKPVSFHVFLEYLYVGSLSDEDLIGFAKDLLQMADYFQVLLRESRACIQRH